MVELVSYFIAPTYEGLTLSFMWAGSAGFMVRPPPHFPPRLPPIRLYLRFCL